MASLFFNDEVELQDTGSWKLLLLCVSYLYFFYNKDIAENEVLSTPTSTPTQLIGFSADVESILMESEFPEAEFDEEFNIIFEDDNEDSDE